MKRILLICLGLLALASCRFREDDAFELSPGQRFEQKTSEYEKALIAQTAGWIMEYYAGTDQQYGGHTFIVRFEAGRKVYASSEYTTDEELSYYSIDAVDGGAVPSLVFDTYSKVLHEFSTPSPTDIKGKGGDFEFNLSYTDGTFVLQGKKWGNTIRLRPLTGDRLAYLEQVKANKEAMTLAALAPVELQGATIALDMDLGERRLTFGSGETSSSIAFAITDTGIRLYEPITVGGITLSELKLHKETNTLSSPDGKLSTSMHFLAPEINLNELLWTGYLVKDFVSANFLDKFASIRAKEQNIWGGDYVTDRRFQLGKGTAWTGAKLVKNYGSATELKGKYYEIGYMLDFYAVPNQPDQIRIKAKTGGKNWRYFSDVYPLISEIASHAPYVVSAVEQGGESYRKFVSVANADVWFYLRVEDTTPELLSTAWTIDLVSGWVSDDLVEAFQQAQDGTTTYTISPFATIGYQNAATSAMFSVTDTGSGSRFRCNHLIDVVPVFGRPDAVHLIKRRAGYYWSYFTFLQPIVDAIDAESPYAFVTRGGYTRLISIDSPTTWFYKWVATE